MNDDVSLVEYDDLFYRRIRIIIPRLMPDLPRLVDRDCLLLRLRLFCPLLFLYFSSSLSPANRFPFRKASFAIVFFASSYVPGVNSIYL